MHFKIDGLVVKFAECCQYAQRLLHCDLNYACMSKDLSISVFYIDNQKQEQEQVISLEEHVVFSHRIVTKIIFLDKNVKYMTITWINKLSVKIILPLKALRLYMCPKKFDFRMLTYLYAFTQITTVQLLTIFQIICLVQGVERNN